MKAQMKAADRSGARMALIIGDDERAQGTVTVRDLRSATEQRVIARADVAGTVSADLARPAPA
jgi:histidyl-tRNA synthetase